MSDLLKMMSVIDELEKRGIDIPLKHVANSGAIIDLPSTYLDAVRSWNNSLWLLPFRRSK